LALITGAIVIGTSNDWGASNVLRWAADRVTTGQRDASPTRLKGREPWQRLQKLTSAPLPPRPTAAAPRSVLFLPLLNRSEQRLHPRFAAAFGETLAAAAHVFGGWSPISPAVSRRLGQELGFSEDYESGSALELDASVLEAAAERVGASAVVLLELSKDGTLRVRSIDFGDSGLGGWDGLEIRLWTAKSRDRTLDRRVLDGPRELLSALVSSGRAGFELPASTTPPQAARDSLAEILASLQFGTLAELRNAEMGLVSLARAHPGWRAPWIELAALRFLRPLSLGFPPEAALLREGPSPARHVARVLGGLEDPQRARLDAIDFHFVPREVRTAELSAVMARLAGSDILRPAIATLHPDRPRGVFGLEGLGPETIYEALLLAQGGGAGEDKAHQAVAALGEQLSQTQRIASGPLLAALYAGREANGDWKGERHFSLVAVPGAWISGMSVARDICLDLPEAAPSRNTCLTALQRGLAVYAPESKLPASSTLLADESQWMRTLGAATARLFDSDLAPLQGPDVPDVKGAQTSWTRHRWFAAAELIRTANEVREARWTDSPLATSAELLAGDATLQLSTPIEQLLTGLYLEPEIGRRRAQRDETEPYLEILAAFDGFPTGLAWQANIRHRNGERKRPAAMLDTLNRADPYDSRWRKRWLHYFAQDERYNRKPEDLIAWLERLVPRTTEIELSLADLHWRAFGEARGASWLRQTLEDRMDDRLTELYVAWIDEGIFRDSEKIAILERALAEFPHPENLRSKLAHLYRYVGKLDRADKLARSLLGTAKHQEACQTLAYVEANRGNPAGMVEILESCAESASNKWHATRLFTHAGFVATDLGHYERAAGLYDRAHEKVGGASWVIEGQGLSAEWAGDFERAEERFEAGNRSYKRPSWLRLLASLHLRQGNVARAREAMGRVFAADAPEAEDYEVMTSIYVREGDLAGLERYLRGEDNRTALRELAKAYEFVGDLDGAVRVLDEVLASTPNSLGTLSSKAAKLLALERYDEAIAIWEPLLANPEWARTARVGLVAAYARSGRSVQAKELVEEYARHYPLHRTTAEWHAIVAEGEGRKADALKWYAKYHSQTPTGRDKGIAHAEAIFAVLLREEQLGRPARGGAELKRMLAQAEFVANKLHLDDDAWSLLARLRAASGDRPGASEASRTAALVNPIRSTRRLANAQ
jgi:tetratricopeptide (TPR) repeat protein